MKITDLVISQEIGWYIDLDEVPCQICPLLEILATKKKPLENRVYDRLVCLYQTLPECTPEIHIQRNLNELWFQ